MYSSPVYRVWYQSIRELRPQEHKARVGNFARVAEGVFRSRSVHLSRIASKIPGHAVQKSKIQRVSRFLNNPSVRVRQWYGPTARLLLEEQLRTGGEIRLIVDCSKIGFGHQLLSVSLAYRRRTIPIAWTWVPCRRGHSSASKQIALLRYVYTLIPPGASVSLTGDSEFGAVEVLRLFDAWGWGYALRQKGSHLIQLKGHTWIRLGDLVQSAGQSVWLENVLLTQQHAHPCNLLAHWHPGEKEPWLLATNLPSKRQTLTTYRRRMWIEEMFGDFKKHGFDLESTHLRHFMRLSRLTLVVAFLYLWLVAFGSKVIKNGQRKLVDRPERRDLSVFRIGFDMIERLIQNRLPITMQSKPYF